MLSKTIHVKGKVQGVYFRASAKQQALLLGLHGNVRNCADGSVQLNVSGTEEDVAKMINWCKHGPALARVKEVEVEEGPQGVQEDFTILH